MVFELVAAANCMPSRSNRRPGKEKYLTPDVYQFPLRDNVHSVPRLRGAPSLGRSCHDEWVIVILASVFFLFGNNISSDFVS